PSSKWSTHQPQGTRKPNRENLDFHAAHGQGCQSLAVGAEADARNSTRIALESKARLARHRFQHSDHAVGKSDRDLHTVLAESQIIYMSFVTLESMIFLTCRCIPDLDFLRFFYEGLTRFCLLLTTPADRGE